MQFINAARRRNWCLLEERFLDAPCLTHDTKGLDMSVPYFAHSRSEMLKYVPARVKVALDVGCGEGNFAALLKQDRNCSVWGVEPNIEAAEVARQKLDVLINGSFDHTITLGDQRFDCVIFNDVLEHLVDPWAALELAKKHLAPHGVVVSSIPNIRFFWCILEILLTKDWKYRDAGILDKTHLRFFTMKSIVRLFEESQFRVTKIEGIHPTTHKYFQLFNIFLLNRIEDMRYEQFAIVAERAED